MADCLTGRGQAVLLDGPIASGRTELLRTIGERAVAAGLRLLNATCSRGERVLPLGVVTQLVRGVDRVGGLLDRDLTTVPDLADAELVQLFDDLSAALLDLAVSTPLMIAVDDIRHADRPSQRFLLHLVRRSGEGRVLVVVTDDLDQRPSHLPFRTELLRQPHARRISLAPLSAAGVAELAARRLGPAPAQQCESALFSISGGNLLLLEALIEDRGEPSVDGYGLALLACLQRAEPFVTQVACGLAVLDEEVPPDKLGQLVGVETGDAARALEDLNASGLLDCGRFRHSVARTVVLAGLAERERAELRRRAAHLTQERGATALTVARHLVAADDGTAPWAVAVLQEAAEYAQLDRQPQLAVDCLELAHRSAADERSRVPIRARLAEAEWQVNPSIAAKHLSPLVTAMRAGRLDDRDGFALIRQLLWHGRTDEATHPLDQVRGADSGRPVPASELSPELRDIERWLAAVYPALASRRTLALSARAQANPVTSGLDPWLRSVALLSELLVGNPGAGTGASAEDVLRDLQIGSHRSWAYESLLMALMVLIYVDDCDAAAAWCARLAGRSPTWQALIAGAMAEISVRHGDLAAAVRQAQLALTHLSPKAWGVAVGLPLGSLILATTRMGDYDSGAKFLTYAIPEGMFSSRYGLHYLYARGHYHLATNHPQAALADFMSCSELMRGWGLDIAGLVRWRTAAAEAWLRLGNKDQARVLISDQLARPGTDDSRARAGALRLLAATREPNRRPQLLTEALEIFESRGDRFEQARVLTDLSHAYNAMGKKRRARLMFRRAAHVADMCGAKPLYQDLLAVSDDLPGDVPAPGRSRAIRSLTESERRVASLAVMGYTNREIAAKLFVTASTVEQHLTRVYRKLDVKRRKDLPIELWSELTRKR